MNTVLKEFLRKCLRYTPTYLIEYNRIQKPFYMQTLERSVKKSIADVPFYQKYAQYVADNGPFSLDVFPILRKKDIVGHEYELISNKVCKKLLFKKETGGSSGVSLHLYPSWEVQIKMNCPADYAFSFIGKNLRTAIMRGSAPDNGAVYQSLGFGNVLLSSYLLSESRLTEYLDALRKYKIECLHVYPSSISILARLIKRYQVTATLPDLKGILASSEIFSAEEKKIVMEAFPGVTIVDYYGMSELTCCAYSINGGNYHFLNNFGYAEFVDTGETVNGHRIAEIIATSISNTTMPLIRYGTEDYVELDAENNVVSIIGRTSDFVLNKKEELVPCIIVPRDESMKNVMNFQYYQPRVGDIVFRVVVSESFSEKERLMLVEDMDNSFNHNMNCDVHVVKDVERTKAGKQKRLIQCVDMRLYK